MNNLLNKNNIIIIKIAFQKHSAMFKKILLLKTYHFASFDINNIYSLVSFGMKICLDLWRYLII